MLTTEHEHKNIAAENWIGSAMSNICYNKQRYNSDTKF